MASKKSKAVAKKEAAQVAPVTEDVLADMRANAGEGNEFTKDDLAIPFLSLCQSQSPHRKKSNSKYIEGLEEGEIFNTVTGEIYGDEVRVIPVKYEKVYVEWVPQDAGGGYVATYDDRETAYEECMAGNEIVDTANHYVLVENPETGAWSEAVLTLKSTGLKISRKWNSLATMRKVDDGDGGTFTPPLYAQVFTLAIVEESNDKGEWFNRTVSSGPLVPEIENGPEIYTRAKAFRRMVDQGVKRVDYAAEVGDDDTADDDPEF